LKNVIFLLDDVKRKIGEKFTKNRVSPACLSNTLSCINHLLWDKNTADFFFKNERARTSFKGYTLEDMCMYWANYHTNLFRSGPLTMTQETLWGRCLFCLTSLLMHPSFYHLLTVEGNFVELILNMMKNKPHLLMRDVKGSICKCLMMLVRDETVQIDVNIVLKFLNGELKRRNAMGLLSPDRMIGTNVVLHVFYDMMGSLYRTECEKILKEKYSILRSHLEFTNLDVHQCHKCGKEQTTSGEKLKRCSRCFSVWYCSVACQKQDWTNHRASCVTISTKQSDAISQHSKQDITAEKLKEEGNTCFKQKNYRRAIVLYVKASDLDDSKPIMHILMCNIAMCYYCLGEHDKCVKYCDSALEADGKYIKAYYKKIQSLVMMKRTIEAGKVLDKALYLEPNNEQLLSLKKMI